MIAILADTHMPKGSRRLPERCVEALATAEAVIHAGDFSAASVLEEMQALCPVVHAVHGNVDEPQLQGSLPAALEIEIGRRTLAITHDAGPAKGRLARLRRRFPNAEAVVFGHSHLPLHEVEGGFQIFNPGSPTERRRAPRWASSSPARAVWLSNTFGFDGVRHRVARFARDDLGTKVQRPRGAALRSLLAHSDQDSTEGER